MTRIKRGNIARKRRTKIRLFTSSFRGAHSRLTRTSTQQKIKALVSAHRDKDRQKRTFRRLWVTRINAEKREMRHLEINNCSDGTFFFPCDRALTHAPSN